MKERGEEEKKSRVTAGNKAGTRHRNARGTKATMPCSTIIHHPATQALPGEEGGVSQRGARSQRGREAEGEVRK